jgi:hypothetical protein
MMPLVFDGSALPARMRVAEEGFEYQGLRQVVMKGELLAVVKGDALPGRLRQRTEDRA